MIIRTVYDVRDEKHNWFKTVIIYTPNAFDKEMYI